jgi:hypothetical protein
MESAYSVKLGPETPTLEQSERPLTFGSLDLAHFAYSPKHGSSLTASPLRRSPRKPSARLKTEDSLRAIPDAVDSDSQLIKRPRGVESESRSPKRIPKKPKRTYATPETYAHLNGLQDCLKEQLDGSYSFIQVSQSVYRWLIMRLPSYVLWN